MKLIVASALMAAALTLSAEDSGRTLTKDPFRQPLLEEIIDVEVTAELVPIVSEPKQIPELRGILRSPRETLVNLNGRLLTVGGKFEGFTVAEIGERNAVLLDGKNRHIVSIDDKRDARNEQRYR